MNYYFRCPNCGSNEEFIKPSEESSNAGCAIFLFGGLIPALLFANDRQGRIQCAKCAHIFRQPRIPVSALAAFAAWIVALLSVPILVVVVVGFADHASSLPSVPIIASVEEFITAQPRLTAFALAFGFVLIVIVCWAVAFVSNARFRKQLSTEYRLEPLSPDELAQKTRESDYPIETVTRRNVRGESESD